MSTNVNPPLNLKIPRRLSSDVESDAFFRNLITILFQLWERSGGGDDTVSDLENEQPDTDSLFGLFSRVNDLEQRDVAVITDDHTAIYNQIIICNNDTSKTVTLNAEPKDQELIVIKRSGASVLIDGNGKTIDGKDSWRINTKYTSLDIIYSVKTDSWHIV